MSGDVAATRTVKPLSDGRHAVFISLPCGKIVEVEQGGEEEMRIRAAHFLSELTEKAMRTVRCDLCEQTSCRLHGKL